MPTRGGCACGFSAPGPWAGSSRATGSHRGRPSRPARLARDDRQLVTSARPAHPATSCATRKRCSSTSARRRVAVVPSGSDRSTTSVNADGRVCRPPAQLIAAALSSGLAEHRAVDSMGPRVPKSTPASSGAHHRAARRDPDSSAPDVCARALDEARRTLARAPAPIAARTVSRPAPSVSEVLTR